MMPAPRYPQVGLDAVPDPLAAAAQREAWFLICGGDPATYPHEHSDPARVAAERATLLGLAGVSLQVRSRPWPMPPHRSAPRP